MYRFFGFWIQLWLISIMLTACWGDDTQQGKNNAGNTEFKPETKGGVLEILVVMDSQLWRSALGDSIRAVLAEPLPGLPQDEPRFKLIQIAPDNFSNFLKRHPNVLMVVPLEDNSDGSKLLKAFLTKESLQKLIADDSKFVLTKEDEFALGQKMVFIYGRTIDRIIAQLNTRRAQLIDLFHQAERERATKKLYGGGGENENKSLGQALRKHTSLSLRAPGGFMLAREDSNFFWIRQIGGATDKSIWVSWGKYTSPEMFDTAFVVKWRNHFGFKMMNDTTIKGSYMDTQDDAYPVIPRKFLLKGKLVVEYRGLWKLHNNSRGGAFISYAFVDEKNSRFYYIEGFLYAPGEDKRKLMLEMEAILRSFVMP